MDPNSQEGRTEQFGGKSCLSLLSKVNTGDCFLPPGPREPHPLAPRGESIRPTVDYALVNTTHLHLPSLCPPTSIETNNI